MVGLGILDQAAIGAGEPSRNESRVLALSTIRSCPASISRTGWRTFGRAAADPAVDEDAGGQQAGGPRVQAEAVGGDEGLAFGVRGEQGRVAQGDREGLAAVGQPGPGDPQALAARDADARMQAGADQGQGVDPVGLSRRRRSRRACPPN